MPASDDGIGRRSSPAERVSADLRTGGGELLRRRGRVAAMVPEVLPEARAAWAQLRAHRS